MHNCLQFFKCIYQKKRYYIINFKHFINIILEYLLFILKTTYWINSQFYRLDNVINTLKIVVNFKKVEEKIIIV